MSLLGDIYNRIKGIIPVRGTLTTPTSSETYPVAISNQLLGGPFIVGSMDELGDLPFERLVVGCKCAVQADPLDSTSAIVNMTLVKLPNGTTGYTNLAEMKLNSVISEYTDYWALDVPRQLPDTTIQTQYAPSVNNAKPLFLSADITTANYNAGYSNNIDKLVIWVDTYDHTAEHEWVRQKPASSTDWGVPTRISASYEEGDFKDLMFKVLPIGTTPDRPSSTYNGSLNNRPVGWQDTPPAIGVGEHLWQIVAIKDAYMQLKGEWSNPLNVSEVYQGAKYGNNPSKTPDELPSAWSDVYTNQQYRARPYNGSWIIERISDEGTYQEFVYKQFPNTKIVTSADKPTIVGSITATQDGWRDAAFVPDNGYTLYFSMCVRNNAREIVTDWSDPQKSKGDNAVNVVLEYDTQLFSVLADGTVTPNDIELTLKIYDGLTSISTTDPAVSGITWYKDGNSITPTSSGKHTVLHTDINGRAAYSVRVKYGELNRITQPVTITDLQEYDKPYLNILGSPVLKLGETNEYKAELYLGSTRYTIDTYKWKVNAVDKGTAPAITLDSSDIANKDTLSLECTYTKDSIVESILTEMEIVDISDGLSVLLVYIDSDTTPGTPSGHVIDGVVQDVTQSFTWYSIPPPNTKWMCSGTVSPTEVLWTAPVKVKGEKGDSVGIIQRTVYIRFASGDTIPPGFESTTPTANATGPLFPADVSGKSWTIDVPITGTGDRVYTSTAIYTKSTSTQSNDLDHANWVLDGSWSKPYLTTYIPADGVGVPGDNGWSPVLATEAGSGVEYLKVIDWTGGSGSKPSLGYVGATGIVPSVSDAVNIKGIKGDKGDAGTFNPAAVAVGDMYMPHLLSSVVGTAQFGDTVANKNIRFSFTSIMKSSTVISYNLTAPSGRGYSFADLAFRKGLDGFMNLSIYAGLNVMATTHPAGEPNIDLLAFMTVGNSYEKLLPKGWGPAKTHNGVPSGIPDAVYGKISYRHPISFHIRNANDSGKGRPCNGNLLILTSAVLNSTVADALNQYEQEDVNTIYLGIEYDMPDGVYRNVFTATDDVYIEVNTDVRYRTLDSKII